MLSFVLFFLCIHSASYESGTSLLPGDSGLSLLIKKRVAEGRIDARAAGWGEQIYSDVLVASFYKGRDYQPAWSQDGRPVQVEMLIRAVEEAYGDGLTPDYYHLGLIKSLVGKIQKESSPDPARLADLDVILTDAFLTLGCHLSGGCVNPVTMEAEWFTKHRTVDVSSVLEQALKKKQIRDALTGLRPGQGSYTRLKQALARYREFSTKGEWPLVSSGPSLKKDTLSSRVIELRTRLSASGDLDAEGAKGGDLFDERLQRSVIVFQKLHGLKADGVVGAATLAAINVPLKQRIRQIELNMERLRWILGNLEERFIVVNIANYQLDVIENGKPVLSMKVVVGKPYQRTPVFTAKMTHLVINPSWNIPDSIARKEILKKVKNNPRYLAEQNIKVLTGWGTREGDIDPESIDWSKITPGSLPYRFRQEPGPLNPLGQLKFMFPNTFDVYLHDTPAKRLFGENIRTFSHGCTRIEKPIDLAEYVLGGDPRRVRENIVSAIQRGSEQTVLIPHPLNVHFLYLTAWVDDEGNLQFRNDVYGRDKLLDEALRKKPSFR